MENARLSEGTGKFSVYFFAEGREENLVPASHLTEEELEIAYLLALELFEGSREGSRGTA